jgi:aspartate aminotransferase
MNFADRVERVEPSATLAISNAAGELEAEGVDVVDLSVGEPDFDTPEVVVEAGKQALDDGHHGYTASNGIQPLRDAVAEDLQAKGLDQYGPGNVVVTPGAKQALYETFQTLVDDGDEVVLLDPAWVSYEAQATFAGARLSRLDLSVHDFQLEPGLDDLAAVVTDDTELLVVNSPSNPTGAVFSDAALEGVRDLAVDHDVTVLSDEIYDDITYGVDPTSLGTLEGMAERTVTVDGFSKSYAMTGWRLGYLAAPEAVVDQVGKVHSHSVSCAANFVQHAGVTALEEADDAVAEMRDAFRQRRDLLVDLFADHGVDVTVPDGAFYLMVPCDANDAEWCERAIEDAHVAMVPGSAFGAPGYARISYAAGTERLREGVERLAEADLL